MKTKGAKKFVVGHTYRMRISKYGYVKGELVILVKKGAGNSKHAIIEDANGMRRREISIIHIENL